jgi:hypothetical protein
MFQHPLESFNHFEKRLPSESKPEFWELDFSIFVEKFKDVRASLVGSNEILPHDGDFLLVAQTHVRLLS